MTERTTSSASLASLRAAGARQGLQQGLRGRFSAGALR